MEYSKSDFYRDVFISLHSEDKINDRLFMGDSLIKFSINDIEMSDVISMTKDKINDVIVDLDITHKMEELSVINILETSFTNNPYTGLNVEIEFEKLYQAFIDENIIQEKKEPAVFYRIEDKDGVGFYSHYSDKGNPLHDIFDMSTNATPSPLEDPLIKGVFYQTDNREKIQFGFKDYSQINNWLNGVEQLGDFIAGNDELFVSKYEIQDKYLITSERQSVYEKGNETLIEQTPLPEYLSGRKHKKEYDDKLNNGFSDEDIKVVKSFLKKDDGDVLVVEKKKNNRRKNNKNQLNLF